MITRIERFGRLTTSRKVLTFRRTTIQLRQNDMLLLVGSFTAGTLSLECKKFLENLNAAIQRSLIRADDSWLREVDGLIALYFKDGRSYGFELTYGEVEVL